MRSTSSRRSAVALLLCGTLLRQIDADGRRRGCRGVDGTGAPAEIRRAGSARSFGARGSRPDSRDRREGAPDPVAPRPDGTFREGSVHRGDPGSRRRGLATDRREGVPRLRTDGEGRERRRGTYSRGGREGVPVVPVHGGDAPVPRGDLSPAGDPPSLGGEGIRRRGALFPRAGVASGIHPGPRPVSPPGAVRMGSDQAPPRARSGTPGRVAPLRRGDLRRRRASGSHPGPRSNEKYRAGPDPRLPPGIQGCRNDGSMASGGHGDIALLPSRRSGGSPRRTSCRRRAGKRRRRGPPGRGTLRGGGDPAGRDPDARKGERPAKGCAHGSMPEDRRAWIRLSSGKRRSPRGRRGRRSPGSGSPTPLPRTGGPGRNGRRDPGTKAPGSGVFSWPSAVAAAFGAGGGGGGSGGSSGGTVAVNF